MESTTDFIPYTNITVDTFNLSLENGTTLPYQYNSLSGTSSGNRGLFLTKTVISFIIFPILSLTGLFGNISTVVIYFREKQKTASINLIIALAFADLLYILIRLIAHIYANVIFLAGAIRYFRPTPFFWLLLAQPFQKIGYLCILVITTERVVAVWFPFAYRQIWTTRRAIIISASVVLIPLIELVVVFDYHIYSFNEISIKNGTITTFSENFSFLYYQKSLVALLSFVYRIVFEILPILIVSLLNIIIVIGIRRKSISNVQQDTATEQRRKKEARITKMLLTISIMFVILCGPYTILFTLATVQPEITTNRMIFFEVLHTLMLAHNVVNFVVYGAMDPVWRKAFCKPCGCQK